jgi:hypothetical protein
MRLIYFDENKFSKENPFFFVGGIIVDESKASAIETRLMRVQYDFFGDSSLRKELEFHGEEVFQGKGSFKKRGLAERIKIFEDVSSIIIDTKSVIRIVCIDVMRHRSKYYYPEPEYNLGLMLFFERSCDYLDSIDDIGVVFGDYEKDEITKSILDFSQFKFIGRTPMYFGRPLGRLIDTVYFTHSHHSRFLQVSDLVIFMAGRFENGLCKCTKWHDIQVKAIWENLKANVDIRIQRWP